MADDEGFVRRWSRRKSATRARAGQADPAPATVSPPSPTLPPPSAPPAARDPDVPDAVIDPASLPDIESLTYRSDFTVFLRAGVPAELRKRALQRLWRSDPVLANLDGLVEYGEDYSQIGITPQIVRTAYQVGRGMLDRIEAAAAQSPAEPPSVGLSDRKGDDAEFAQTQLPAVEGSGGEDAKAAAVVDESAPPPVPKQR